MFEQELGRGNVAGARNCHQRGLSVGIGRVGIRAGLEQHLQHLGVRHFGGQTHRGGAVVVGERDIGAGTQQTPCGGDVVVVDSPLQRRAAIRVSAVDVFFRGPAKAGHYRRLGLRGLCLRRCSNQ
jgi:hypothetical protein